MKTLIKILYCIKLCVYENINVLPQCKALIQTNICWSLILEAIDKMIVECRILLLERRNTISLDVHPEVFDVFKALAQNTEMSKQEDGISTSTPITGR